LQIFSYPLDVCKFVAIAGKYYHRYGFQEISIFLKSYLPLRESFVCLLHINILLIFAGLYVFVKCMHLFKSTSVLVVLKSI